MATCKKCKEAKVDNHCGCNHFENLFGYDVNVSKKNSTDGSSNKGPNLSSAVKDVDFKKAGDQLGDFLKGIKMPTQPTQQQGPSYSPQPTPQKSSTSYAWIIGIVVAVIVMFIVWKVSTKKK